MRARSISFLFLLFVLDVTSKIFAQNWIPPMSSFCRIYPFAGVPVFSLGPISFSLNYVVNTGAAWGMLPGFSGSLFAIRMAIVVALIGYLLFFRRSQDPTFPLWLIATGAVGNALDYALYSHVIDFFHFCFWGYSFPIFNFADSYITLGVLTLLWLTRKTKKNYTQTT